MPIAEHIGNSLQCMSLLFRTKRTSKRRPAMSAFDPKRTLNAPNGPAVEAGFSHYQKAPLSRYDAAS
jgi:hypothetical protein